MKMTKYLCKWGSAGKYLEFDHFEVQEFHFFNDDNGYTAENRHLLLKLNKGDRLDLSDGISQYHEIEALT
jgi:hypothetical protein